MRIAIDIREACCPKRTGKGQWTHGFVTELLTREQDLLLMTDSPLPLSWQQHNISVLRFPLGYRWHLRASGYLKSQTDLDFYVSPTSYIVPFLLGAKVPFIPIIHDLIAFRGEPHDRKAQWIERCTLKRTVNAAAHICTISEATKDDLLDRYSSLQSEHVTSIFAGPFREHPPSNMSDGRTILCIGTLCPRKNQHRLILAYAALPSSLRSQYELVLAGSRGWNDAEIVRLAEQTPGVTWRDYVPDDEYESLLSSCTVFAFPSLYEGFGMQVLDALQRGIPLLTSRRGSLAEVAGDAAVLVDPEDVGSITAGLQEILTNQDLQRSLREKGPMQVQQFSWKRTVDLFLEALENK